MSERKSDTIKPPNDLNPYAPTREPQQQIIGAIANTEAQRAVAEVQARMIIARSNPRDPIKCVDRILADCQRPGLAHMAIYQYARGGTDIAGPSIRLAEAIARQWGNLATGIKEISRADGYSECVAYAWDLETGYYDERQFQVRHWRDTRQGGYAITDERDIYELIANMGQRRKRAVLLTVLPGDVVEAAREQCERTLHATADTSPEALRRMVTAFREIGVSQAQIEKRIQRRMEAITPAQVISLRKIFVSIKDEMSTPDDWFEATMWTQTETRAPEKETGQKPQTDAASKPETSAEEIGPNPVEIWATDEFGEPTQDHPFSPMEFAAWFSSKLFATNSQALIEHNADALKEAREADPAAEAEIVGAIMRHDKRAREMAAKPKGPVPVKGPTTRAGYQTEAYAQIVALPSEEHIAAWITANEPTYRNKATAIGIDNQIRIRRQQLEAAALPIPEPTPHPGLISHRLEDIFPGDIPLNESDPS